MTRARSGALALAVAAIVASPVEASRELEEVRTQVVQLQQQLEAEQRESQRRQVELHASLQALQQRLETLATGQPVQPAVQAKALSPPAVSPDRPPFLTRWLQRLGLTLPESGPRPSVGQSRFARHTTSEKYADPSSFFLLHGYTTFTYADFQRGFDSAPGGTEQILVAGNSGRSGKHESGFHNDTALFIGSELTPTLKGLFEIHLVGNARDPVLTESKILWAPFHTEAGQPSLRFVGGRYWWPFGIHHDEWMSAVNFFNLQSPAATEVVPAHYDEVGVMAEGEWALSEHFGVNYLASVGNGVSSFELSDNIGSANAFDADSNRTFTGRVGLFPGIDNLEVGVSFAAGALRRGLDSSFALTDARRYEADLIAYGVDGTYQLKNLRVRGYWYVSEEDLEDALLERLDRNGGTLDVLYTFARGVPLLNELSLKGRVSTAKDATLTNGSFRRSQFGFGLNARPHEHFLLKAEYFLQDEHGIDEVEDNGFTLSGTVEF